MDFGKGYHKKNILFFVTKMHFSLIKMLQMNIGHNINYITAYLDNLTFIYHYNNITQSLHFVIGCLPYFYYDVIGVLSAWKYIIIKC